MRKIHALVAAAFILLSGTQAAAQDVKVIVNSENSTAELPAAVVTKIFLKQSAKFPNGASAEPVDQGKATSARAAFSKSVVGRSVAAVESYWQQQVFSGKEVPPPVKASDEEVIAFVKANPNAIGYVSAGASTAGVKVVAVK